MLALTAARRIVVGGKTTVVQAYYNGRQLGQADLTFDPATGRRPSPGSAWSSAPRAPKNPTIDALITSYASDPTYQTLINQPIGYSASTSRAATPATI